MIVSLFKSEMLCNMFANFCSEFLCKCSDVFRRGGIYDSDQKGISPFNQYFKPNCFSFFTFQIVSTEIGYIFFYISCNASSSFNSIFPLKCIPPDSAK